MAITTFTGDLSAQFAAGTSLEARPAANWAVEKRPPAPGSTPAGSAAATAVLAASGVLSLTGLADNTEYFVSDSAGARYVRITTYPERQEVMTNQAGQANGYPKLDANAKVPWALLAGGPINVKDAAYGASTLVANNAAAIQSAINDGAAQGRAVELSELYPITTGLTIPAGSKLIATQPGAGLDFSAVSGTFTAATILGTLGAAKALNSDAAAGTYTAVLTGTSTGFAADDWVQISDATLYGSTSQQRGEFNRIRTVATGGGNTTLTFYEPLCDTYTAASTGQVKKVTPAENVRIEGLRFLGPADNALSIAGLSAELARNLTVKGCFFHRCQYIAIGIRDSWDWRVQGNTIRDSTRTGLAYGVSVQWGAQDGSVIGNYMENMRHGVTIGGGASAAGISRRITIQGNTIRSIDAGIDSHPSSEDVTVLGNTVIVSTDDTTAGVSDHDGIINQGTRGSIVGNTVRSSSTGTGAGIRWQPEVAADQVMVISANKVTGFQDSILVDTVATYTTFGGASITGNECEGPSRYGIFVNAVAAAFVGLTVTGNAISGSGSHAIYVLGATGSHSRTLTITGNPIAAPGGDSVRVRYVDHVSVTGNPVETASGMHGVYVQDCLDGTVGPNPVRGSAAGGNVGVRLGANVSGFTVVGNRVNAAVTGLLLDNTATNNTVGVNDMRGCTTLVAPGTGAGNRFALTPQTPQTLATNANFTLTPFTSPEQTIHTGTLTADRTVTLSTSNAYAGEMFRITRTGGGAFNLNVGTGPLKAMATNTWAEFVYDGSAWALSAYGAL